MGREAVVHVEVGAEAGEAKVLLESTELILRGDVRRKFVRAAIEAIVVETAGANDDEVLCFRCAGEHVRLHLGKAAAAWAKAMTTAPPTLRSKLGLDDAKAFVVGVVDDVALGEALVGARVEPLAQATLVVAVIVLPEDLATALSTSSTLPVWAVHEKGKAARVGDADIRAAFRQAGFRDTKTCAVSERLTATRYNPAKT